MVQRTLRIPKDLYNLLKVTAKNKGITCNALILSILWGFSEKQGSSSEADGESKGSF